MAPEPLVTKRILHVEDTTQGLPRIEGSVTVLAGTAQEPENSTLGVYSQIIPRDVQGKGCG